MTSNRFKKIAVGFITAFVMVGVLMTSVAQAQSNPANGTPPPQSIDQILTGPLPTDANGVSAEAATINRLASQAVNTANQSLIQAAKEYDEANTWCVTAQCVTRRDAAAAAYKEADAAYKRSTQKSQQAQTLANSANRKAKAGDIKGAQADLTQARKLIKEALVSAKVNMGAPYSNNIAASMYADNPVACTIDPWNFSLEACIRGIFAWVVYLFIVIFSIILKFGGLMLDYAMKYTVLDIKTNLDSIGAIGTIWKVFRDIANLSFIFILLYVAISTILQAPITQARQTIFKIVIAAILINFSLFITKVIIDASNIVTLAFYSKLGVVGGNNLSVKFLEILGMSKVFDISPSNISTNVGSLSASWSSLLSMGIGGAVFIFMAAFSFLAAAWLFIYRYVIIVLLLITSPLAFAGAVIPKTQEYAKKWWNSLIGQALFPVIYMVFLWVTILIATNSLNIKSDSITKGFVAGTMVGADASLMSGVMSFVIIITFLNMALVLAKVQASRSGKHATKFMNWGTDLVESARKGSQGYVGRGLVRGSGLKKLDDKFKDTAFANTRFGQAVRNRTTGALTGMKFQSKYSVSDVDKEKKKLGEAFAKKRIEKLEEKNDKDYVVKRQNAIDMTKSELASTEVKLSSHDDAMKAEKAKLERAEAVAKATEKRFEQARGTKEHGKAEANMLRSKTYVKNIQTKLEEMKKTRQGLVDKKVFTKDELTQMEKDIEWGKKENLALLLEEEAIQREDKWMTKIREKAAKFTPWIAYEKNGDQVVAKKLRDKIKDARKGKGGGKGGGKKPGKPVDTMSADELAEYLKERDDFDDLKSKVDEE